jgi:hypothetical protein
MAGIRRPASRASSGQQATVITTQPPPATSRRLWGRNKGQSRAALLTRLGAGWEDGGMGAR